MAGALSRRHGEEIGTSGFASKSPTPSCSCISCFISFPTPTWLSNLKLSYATDSKIQAVIHAIQSGSDVPQDFTFCNGLLFYKGKLYLGDSNGDLKFVVLQQVHNSPLGGHLGYLKSLHRL